MASTSTPAAVRRAAMAAASSGSEGQSSRSHRTEAFIGGLGVAQPPIVVEATLFSPGGLLFRSPTWRPAPKVGEDPMPELPEVEIVRRELSKLRGATIVRVESNDRRVFDRRTDVVGRVVREVGRRGKWLRFELDDGLVFSHLGMTGDWALRAPDDAALPFERVRMDLEQRRKVTSARYTDPRRFGRFISTTEDIDAWRKLGPDPWLDGIDEPRVLAVLEKRRRAIKEVLLDQSLLAGVGNILAIEALWNAKMDPR